MTKIINIGTIKKDKLNKIERKLSRLEEIEADPSKGFKSGGSVHKSVKTYSRKKKHKGDGF